MRVSMQVKQWCRKRRLRKLSNKESFTYFFSFFTESFVIKYIKVIKYVQEGNTVVTHKYYMKFIFRSEVISIISQSKTQITKNDKFRSKLL